MDMTTIGRKWGAVAAMAMVVAWGTWPGTAARGQGAVAFTPQVASILNGAALQTTPVVSADRRYVRLTLTPYFNTVNGFTTYTAPLGAVSGGGGLGAGGGLGGLGGLGGGLGGLGGGAGGGAVGGGGVVNGGFAGMSGVMMPNYGYTGIGMGMPGVAYPGTALVMPGAGYAAAGNYLAGSYPPMAGGMMMGSVAGPGPAVGMGPAGFAPAMGAMPNPGPADPALAAQNGTLDAFDQAQVSQPAPVRAPKRSAAARRQAARKAQKRPASEARRVP
jgi:hypothetical protein